MMRLTTAMLADAAQVQGGKLFVLGGGFDTISARTVPVVHRSLTLAMVAEVDPDERHRDLEIAIVLVDEDGQALDVEAKGKLRVATGIGKHRPDRQPVLQHPLPGRQGVCIRHQLRGRRAGAGAVPCGEGGVTSCGTR